MIKYIIYTLISLAIVVIALPLATILKQGVSLTESPGIKIRLAHFLRQNKIKTANDHAYPELRTKSYADSSKQLKKHIIDSISNLGWELKKDQGNKLHIIISSTLIDFKDDMHIELIPDGANKTKLHIESSSRVGRADFAANLGHVLKLHKQLKQTRQSID